MGLIALLLLPVALTLVGTLLVVGAIRIGLVGAFLGLLQRLGDDGGIAWLLWALMAAVLIGALLVAGGYVRWPG